MNTCLLSIDNINIDKEKILRAADFIKSGGLVAFPTETVYGLGADAENEEAVKNIFKAKGRPQDNPLIVHVADMELCERYVESITDSALKLVETFWGGPLTIVMKKSKYALDSVTAGGNTVAVRMPSHPVAHALIKASETGIVAPSANISGLPSPTVADHVIRDFDGRIECIISSGATYYGVESTVIDISGDVPQILRPGAVSLEMVREILPDAVYGGGGVGIPKSPGMKYKHYSPNAEVYVVKGDISDKLKNPSDKIAVIDFEDRGKEYENVTFLSAGKNDEDYAARLYYLLRTADDVGATKIYATDPMGGAAITDALKNRLYKSAGGKFV